MANYNFQGYREIALIAASITGELLKVRGTAIPVDEAAKFAADSYKTIYGAVKEQFDEGLT